MTNPIATLDTLRRPRLLINAARIGTSEYIRDAHLSRHIGTDPLPPSDAALHQLIEIESEINSARCARMANYSVARHVDVLIAIMGEARLLRASQPVDDLAL